MLKALVIMLALGAGGSFACSGGFITLQGSEFAPGEYYVLRTQGWIAGPSIPADTIGISRIADMRDHLDSVIQANPLVFIGRIDSTIGNGVRDTTVAGLIPDYVLLPRFMYAPGNPGPGFYARIQVDTVLKGNLPSRAFWVRGYLSPNSCTLGISAGSRFLNFSDALDSISDLKINVDEDFCEGCPEAHWFDGRYLRSPDFPVLSMDIRELFPEYPVAVRGDRPGSRVPRRVPGKADESWRPDGRFVPDNAKPGKNPAPRLRRAP